MIKFFVVACGFLLTACAAGNDLAGHGGIDGMQNDVQIYVPREGDFYAPPSAETRPTSTCKMRGQGAQCY